jgi:hypothetical protein
VAVNDAVHTIVRSITISVVICLCHFAG